MAESTGRRSVLVGSVPAPDAETAMRWALEALGEDLVALPDGETGERSQWVAATINKMRSNPALRVKRDGDWTSYDDRPEMRIRRGKTLTADSLDLGYVAAFEQSFPIYQKLVANNDEPIPLQVGIPSPFDMATFALGPTGAVRNRSPFTQATVAEIEHIRAIAGHEVIFQLELPAELVFVTRAPRVVQRRVARWMARVVTEVPRAVAPGARFALHLCLGDLGNKALARLSDASPVTHLANALIAQWPAGSSLEYLHVPLAAGDEVPPLDGDYYAPLADLSPEAGRILIAGFVHEGRTEPELARIRDIVDQLVGRPVGVACACGLGRREPAVAHELMATSARLCL